MTGTSADADPSALENRRAWERPGAHEVAPGVFRIPLPLPTGDGLRAVNVYAVLDGDQLTMIDSGWALEESRDRLDAALGSIGRDLSSITRFLVTHAHIDHYTQAVVIRRALGTRVLVGADEAATIRQVREPGPDGLMDVDRRLLTAGASPRDVFALARARADERAVQLWEDPDGWLRDGMTIPTGSGEVVVVATPGHTQGHVVFHDRVRRLLFAGDHVLPHITPSIGFEAAVSRSPLSDFLRSLDVVEALGESALLPAHGPVVPSALARVAELKQHHRVRLELTERAVQVRARTAWEVAEQLLWTSRGRAFDDLDPFNRLLAANETLAHLRLLSDQGHIQSSAVDGIDYFEAGDPC